SGRGNGLISSVVTTIEETFGLDIKVRDYTEHALGSGRDARAAAYLECESAGQVIWGCGIDTDVATASVRAVLSAANSAIAGRG
ncbi:MAG: alpha-isopropylmalate synthase regulatory domain-containing protein, partial [Pseudomonadota bacterium]